VNWALKYVQLASTIPGVQREPLDGQLAEDAERPLGVDDAVRMRKRRAAPARARTRESS
jgi:hypothetical protein